MAETQEVEVERCEPCQLAAAVSVSHNICREIKDIGEDCARLLDDVQSGRRSVADYLAEVYVRASNDPRLRGQMDEVLTYLQEGLRGASTP